MRLLVTAAKPHKHPAKFSPGILAEIRELLDAREFTGLILDPFGGTGLIHTLRDRLRPTISIELEPEWANQRAGDETVVGDCRVVMREMYRKGRRVNAIITSPAYGNRFADKDMRESCAGTYMKGLQREASAGSSCHLQWGPKYKRFHCEAWAAAVLLLELDGVFVLNIQDHYRGKRRQGVAGWHVGVLEELGMRVVDIVPVPTAHLKRGANSERCTELLIAMEKAA